MKKCLLVLSILTLTLVLRVEAQQPFKIIRFDEVYQLEPEVHEKIQLTPEQVTALETAEEERKTDPAVAAADQAFQQARGTEEEADAKKKWQDARWEAQNRFAEKVAATLTDDQKSLVTAIEDAYKAARGEIKAMTEGLTDKAEIREKSREVWAQQTASLWPTPATPTPSPAPTSAPATP